MNETREYYEEKLIAAEETIEELRERLAVAESALSERETPLPLETQYAWCAQEMGLAPGERGSTGVCERHRAELLQEAFADRESERSGKRLDQVLFSGAVLLLALAVGVLAGAWLAVARYGGMGVLR